MAAPRASSNRGYIEYADGLYPHLVPDGKYLAYSIPRNTTSYGMMFRYEFCNSEQAGKSLSVDSYYLTFLCPT